MIRGLVLDSRRKPCTAVRNEGLPTARALHSKSPRRSASRQLVGAKGTCNSIAREARRTQIRTVRKAGRSNIGLPDDADRPQN